MQDPDRQVADALVFVDDRRGDGELAHLVRRDVPEQAEDVGARVAPSRHLRVISFGLGAYVQHLQGTARAGGISAAAAAVTILVRESRAEEQVGRSCTDASPRQDGARVRVVQDASERDEGFGPRHHPPSRIALRLQPLPARQGHREQWIKVHEHFFVHFPVPFVDGGGRHLLLLVSQAPLRFNADFSCW